MDKIFIRELLLRCIIGIYPEEREKKQDVVINIELGCLSFLNAAEADHIDEAVNYKTITKDIIQLVEPSSYQLIETLAEKIAQRCLEDQRVLQAKVSIDKPGALRFARSVAVEITRSREEG